MKNSINNFKTYLESSWKGSKDYLRTINWFNEYLIKKYNHEFNIQDINLTHILNFIEYFRNRPLISWRNKWKLPESTYVKSQTKALRQFFKFLNIMDISQLKYERIPNPKVTEKTWDMCTEYEYRIMLEATRHIQHKQITKLRDELMISIPYYTWLRRSEITRLTFNMFESPIRQFQCQIKWKKLWDVFYPPELKKLIWKYKKELIKYMKNKNIDYQPNYIFVSLWRGSFGKPLCPRLIWRCFELYSELLIKQGKLNRNIHPHMLRHLFAMRCVMNWLDQQATTALMRHSDPKTTLRYYHLNNEYLLSQYDKIK